MDLPLDITSLSEGKFAVGQPVARKEDPVLLRGEGRYTDDLSLPDQLHAVMLRSPIAHGVLGPLDLAEARSMPGVVAIVTAAELAAAAIRTMPAATGKNRDGSSTPRPAQSPLATDRVRYVGEPIAMIVAASAAEARDAAEAILPEIEALPAVTTASEAAAPGAPQLHEAAPGNVCLDFHYGDTDKVAAAFAAAAHVTRLSLRNNRVVVCPMEPRSAIGEYDAATGRFVLRLGCQGVFGQRALIASVLGVPVEKVRVLTGNVGGSFGMKASCYPEYICLLHAARVLGRPVKWTDARTESFLSDSHGRDHEMTCELALAADGRFLALRVTGYGNLGAWLSNATVIPPTLNTVKNIIGVYATPLVEVSTRCLFSNTTPVGAYRGAGRPEGNYYMERLVETAAREMGIDSLELRRRNHIRPGQMPYRAPSGMVYDDGDFPTVLAKALRAADWAGYAARRAESEAQGRLRGRGVGQYLEVTADAGNEMGGIRFEPDGSVTIITGTLDYGQGHASPFAQVLAGRLGIPFDRIRLLQGDSDEMLAGGGTGGSRSMMQSGGAILEASDLVVERGKRLAAHRLEVDTADVEFHQGRFTVVGTDIGVSILELASWVRSAEDLPDDLPRTLDVSHVFKGVPSAFPNGCHIAEVEVDPETGIVELVRYATVNDFGVLVNPMLVAGQAHGGIAQGFGQALLERVNYDEAGQPLTGSYMDYGLPRAGDLPDFSFESHPVPARTNPLGVKGCGEAGCAGSLPAVVNALVDALSVFGVTHIDMPATPERVWQAIADARGLQRTG
ncbi:xanthine dehydrogenase family protein molybdopterin-binding subunit [Paracraurococcus lichenis]|uniref:Xanthine dehydrogenase family protein molybdopterin-binding subunit n=1 Tax=Paracraurococcus lichenis TaxID=3064888 RepID=A0ABT9EAN9_9PROT|nr:xanthine dehydrogenase family protein molybdopterin-binding subunit [Paracraurococcus sp. LOR1-02]MDO9713272.1 xanthine dehydrogenase family protein molybdopterin-binding subunit [Paracraurococcus sp. LOR1-02]